MNRFAPVWAYALNRSRKAARLGAEVRSLRQQIAIVTAERDRARELVAAMTCEGFSAEDEAMVGSWLEGEEPA